MKYSYESEDLILEVKEDIAEFGAEEKVYVWKKTFAEYDDAQFVVNYDFIVKEQPLKLDEIQVGESVEIISLGKLLALLEEQNGIL